MLRVPPSHLLASLLSLLLGCSGAGAPPQAPACPEGVSTVAASAVVEVLPPEVTNDAAPPVLEATKWHAQLADSGKGPRHPDVVEAKRRRAALEAWFLKQKRHEAEALKAIVAAWDRQEKRRVPKPLAWQRALTRASLAYLESSAEPDAVAFIAPASLRLAAHEAAALAIDEARLDARYGSRHPQRIAVRAQRQAARDRFKRDRIQHVKQLRGRLVELEKARSADDAPAPTDERTERLREEREHLVNVILELDRRQLATEQSAPRIRVRDVCAPVPESKP